LGAGLGAAAAVIIVLGLLAVVVLGLVLEETMSIMMTISTKNPNRGTLGIPPT